MNDPTRHRPIWPLLALFVALVSVIILAERFYFTPRYGPVTLTSSRWAIDQALGPPVK